MTELVHSSTELWKRPSNLPIKEVKTTVCSFLDVATTSFGRATHYNTREEQQAAELSAHDKMMVVSRDLYTVFLALPGVTDRSIQLGVKKLLSQTRNGVPFEFLKPGVDLELMYYLFQSIPPQRMLKMIDAFRVGSDELGLKKANNSRTRKLILRTLLSSPRLQLWCVKYKTKVLRALTHAWGQRKTSIIREILKRDGRLWTTKEQGILATNIRKYAKDRTTKAYESIRFVFGIRDWLSSPLLVAYESAKTDLSKGKSLPPEVLEGIRSTFHKDTPREEIISLTKDSMSKGQKLAVQKRAKEAGVDVEMDPNDYDAIRLYIYAFECGCDEKIAKALDEKAKKAAAAFPAHYNKVGILVDASKSMEGHGSQRLRPMASALAMRDMLRHVGDEGVVHYCSGGGEIGGPDALVRPLGDTSIADGLVTVLEHGPDAVFVISDGYENAPAGRFAEVVKQVREIGIETPIYHLNPVMAAETGGVKELAPNDGVPTVPVQNTTALGTTMVRGMIEADPVRGINNLLRMALSSGPSAVRKLLPERS